MAQLVADYMEREGTKFYKECLPRSIEKQADGRLKVTYCDKKGQELHEVFDTVLMATGNYG